MTQRHAPICMGCTHYQSLPTDLRCEVPEASIKLTMETGTCPYFEAKIQKYNQCHGDKGRFCSGSGGGGGGGGGATVVVGPSGATYITPATSPSNLQDKKFVKPDNITDDEYAALRQYGYTDYATLNSKLRDPKAVLDDKQKWMVENIDSAMVKQPAFERDIRVYRGTDYGKVFGKKKPEELVGAKIKDPAFMSTSTNSEVAERFGNTRIVITVPAGHKGIDMIKTIGTVAAKSEREILLPRGTEIEITRASQTKGGLFGLGKTTYIQAKVVN